jgi:hypothetical protein
MYSSGLPILYPVGCIFYFVYYWVYKFLLLKYYRKTKSNGKIALYSTGFIKYGLLLHMVIAASMFSNSKLIPPK